MPLHLLFLPAKTLSTRKSKHQVELEDQKARAHAASISHHRAGRGVKNGSKVRTCVRGAEAADSGATDTRWLFPVVGDDLAVQKQQSSTQRMCQSQGLAWIKTGPLDPFLRLPTDLDIKDRNMLFHCKLTPRLTPSILFNNAPPRPDLDTTPRLVHGVKKNPIYCPVRECTLVSIADSPLFLQWIIFMAEMMTGASKAIIYARRAAIYASTRKVLANPANFLLDTTLLHLVVASLAETRLGDAKLADKHFSGLLQVLRLRNGLRTFQEIGLHLGLGMLHAFVVGQVPLFRTRGELLDALGRMRMPRACKPVPRLVRRYFEPFCFNGVHIGNLHMLNMILAEEPEGYMTRLLYNVTGSGEGLTPVAMTFMIGQSAFEVGEWFGPNPVVRSWETIEFVRLLGYATVSRQATVRALSSWLTGADCVDVDLDELKVEILDEWDLAQSMGGLMQ